MFLSARLKLTAWYLLIIMVISIAFSVFIYLGANREFNRILRIQRFRMENPQMHLHIFQQFPVQQDIIQIQRQPEPEEMEEARMRVLTDLIAINVIILVFSSLAGYFLAGRTLKPIKEMMDEQNRFITDASHELRTPLTSLRTEIEVGLRNKTVSSEETKKLLQSNLEEVVALQTLSDDLLELAQNGKEIAKDNLKSYSLLGIVNNAIKKIEPLALKKQMAIEKRIKDVKILAISDRLTEVFIILLDNAIKYSKDKSKIVIESKKEKETVLVSVTNTGIGIAKKNIQHIFDRFYRVNKSRSKKDVPGYGLGLSIAKKIIEFHNGKITVNSVPGKKTTFTISVNLERNS